jgi:hypothetical protein
VDIHATAGTARHSHRVPRIPPYSILGSRFSPFSAFSPYPAFPSTRELPLFGPSLHLHPIVSRPPFLTTMASADFLQFSYTLPHRFLYGRTVRQSPYKLFAIPPRVRASNLRPIQPPHLHHRVRGASDFASLGKLVRPVLPSTRFLFVGPGLCQANYCSQASFRFHLASGTLVPRTP